MKEQSLGYQFELIESNPEVFSFFFCHPACFGCISLFEYYLCFTPQVLPFSPLRGAMQQSMAVSGEVHPCGCERFAMCNLWITALGICH